MISGGGPGPLSNLIPLESIKQAELNQNMKVKDMINNGQWCWPNNWLNEFLVLSTIATPSLCTYSIDKYMWYSSGMV